MADPARENFEFQKIVVVVGFALLAVKFVAYGLTGSVAIFTDATESIVNVVAACVGIYALYLSARPADRSHPFGHGRVEIVSSAIEGSMVVVAGAVILYETAESLLHPGDGIADLDIGLVLVALAAIVNFVVGRAAISRGRRNRSHALEASGRHLCSDTYSSVGIIAGLLVVYAAQALGYDAMWLDSLIAGVFGVVIICTGASVLRKSVADVMDEADEGLVGEVSSVIESCRHEHWIDLYGLRMIKYGPRLFVDMKVVYPRDMTLERLSGEFAEMDEAVRGRFGDTVEVSVHPVPCDDRHCRICDMDCAYRGGGFVKRVAWSPDALSDPDTHADGGSL